MVCGRGKKSKHSRDTTSRSGNINHTNLIFRTIIIRVMSIRTTVRSNTRNLLYTGILCNISWYEYLLRMDFLVLPLQLAPSRKQFQNKQLGVTVL